MRRAGNLWPEIVSFGNLVRAARRAALGKRDVAGVARFLADLEPNVLRLQRELEAGTWAPGRAFTFEIHDPKTRTITAAPFADRVVHHALIDVLEPRLERRMLFESFACRRGKGTHRALAHGLVRRYPWFLKLDVTRAALAGTLIESLDQTIDEGAEALWAEEIERRQRELDQGQIRTIPWSQARRAIQGG